MLFSRASWLSNQSRCWSRAAGKKHSIKSDLGQNALQVGKSAFAIALASPVKTEKPCRCWAHEQRLFSPLKGPGSGVLGHQCSSGALYQNTHPMLLAYHRQLQPCQSYNRILYSVQHSSSQTPSRKILQSNL